MLTEITENDMVLTREKNSKTQEVIMHCPFILESTLESIPPYKKIKVTDVVESSSRAKCADQIWKQQTHYILCTNQGRKRVWWSNGALSENGYYYVVANGFNCVISDAEMATIKNTVDAQYL